MPKLRVEGLANLRVNYAVEVPYTEKQWESLPWQKQNEILDAAIDWAEVCRTQMLMILMWMITKKLSNYNNQQSKKNVEEMGWNFEGF